MTSTPPPEDPPASPPTQPSVPPPAPPSAASPAFAPVPRVPWVNPDRRGHLAATGVAAAVLLLAAGFGIGYAAAPDHGNHYRHVRMHPGMLRQAPNLYPGPRYLPKPRGGIRTVTVTPSPSSTG